MKEVKWNKTSNTSIEDFKYFNWRVQILAKLSLNSISTPAHPQLNSISTWLNLNSTQSQLNSTSTQTTELCTTQLKLALINIFKFISFQSIFFIFERFIYIIFLVILSSQMFHCLSLKELSFKRINPKLYFVLIVFL